MNTLEFFPLPRRLATYRVLLWALRGLGILILLIVASRLRLPSAAGQALAWLALLAAGAAWLRADGGSLLEAAAARRVLVHAQALELRRQGFSRFLVFENLRHVKMVQSPEERVLELELHTDDDMLRLAGFEGMEKVFALVAERKPGAALVEVEERRVDLSDPAPVAWLASGAAALGGWVLAAALGRSGELRLVGSLLLLNGAALMAWRPLSRSGRWWALAGELVLGLAMLGFGLVMWMRA